jgi:hypothetical protein
MYGWVSFLNEHLLLRSVFSLFFFGEINLHVSKERVCLPFLSQQSSAACVFVRVHEQHLSALRVYWVYATYLLSMSAAAGPNSVCLYPL